MIAVLAVFMGGSAARRVYPAGGPGLSIRRPAIARRLVVAAHRRSRAAGHRRSAEDSRHRRRRRGRRIQPAYPDAKHQYGILLCVAQALGRAQVARKSRSRPSKAVCNRQLAGVADGLAFSFPPPAIPGIGTSGGVTMILQDRSGNDDPNFLTKNLFAFLGRAIEAPGNRRRISFLFAGRAATLCRCGSREGVRSSRWIYRTFTPPCRRSWAAIW